jgi:hypothetical protein
LKQNIFSEHKKYRTENILNNLNNMEVSTNDKDDTYKLLQDTPTAMSTATSTSDSSAKTVKYTFLQDQLNDLTDKTRDNVRCALEQTMNFDDMHRKSENLSNESSAFVRQTNDVQNKIWWKRCKMYTMLTTLILVILAILITVIVLSENNNSRRLLNNNDVNKFQRFVYAYRQ